MPWYAKEASAALRPYLHVYVLEYVHVYTVYVLEYTVYESVHHYCIAILSMAIAISSIAAIAIACYCMEWPAGIVWWRRNGYPWISMDVYGM